MPSFSRGVAGVLAALGILAAWAPCAAIVACGSSDQHDIRTDRSDEQAAMQQEKEQEKETLKKEHERGLP